MLGQRKRLGGAYLHCIDKHSNNRATKTTNPLPCHEYRIYQQAHYAHNITGEVVLGCFLLFMPLEKNKSSSIHELPLYRITAAISTFSPANQITDRIYLPLLRELLACISHTGEVAAHGPVRPLHPHAHPDGMDACKAVAIVKKHRRAFNRVIGAGGPQGMLRNVERVSPRNMWLKKKADLKKTRFNTLLVSARRAGLLEVVVAELRQCMLCVQRPNASPLAFAHIHAIHPSCCHR